MCTEPIDSADRCPANSENNVGTHYIAAIVPIYVALTIFAVIVHYLRVHVIIPIIDFHVDRRNERDFSAFVDPSIERIITTNTPASEQLIWADVSLKISRWRNLLLPVGSLVAGGLILSFLPHFPRVAPYFLPIFILLVLPILHLIISGLHQLIKKRHYNHVYLLTSSGATIVYYPSFPLPFFSSPRVYRFPYNSMNDIVQVHVMFKVASIFFAAGWDAAISSRNNGEDVTFGLKKWKNSRIGFENIVKANEVEDLIRQQIAQLSPSNSRSSLTSPRISDYDL